MRKNILWLLLLACSFFSFAQKSLAPTKDSVLMLFFVSDWDNVPEAESKVLLTNVATGEKHEFTTDIEGKHAMLLPKASSYSAEVERFDTVFIFDETEGKLLNIPDIAHLRFSQQYRIKIMQDLISSDNGYVKTTSDDDAKTYKRIFDLDIHFATAKWEIEKQYEKKLNELAKQLTANTNMKIELAAHTDDVGDDASNMLLSQRRANAVRDYLVAKNIATNRILPKGYGEKKPIATNETPEGRATNRRTECRIISE